MSLVQLRFLVAAHTLPYQLVIEGKDPLAVLKLKWFERTLAAAPIDSHCEDAAAVEILDQMGVLHGA